MRIGIMLRSLDEQGGVGVYTRYITESLLALDPHNEYVLLYRSSENLGRFAHHPNVTERVLGGGNKAIWDQIKVPRACRRDRVDVVFHPKFTVPFFAPCPAVMVVPNRVEVGIWRPFSRTRLKSGPMPRTVTF